MSADSTSLVHLNSAGISSRLQAFGSILIIMHVVGSLENVLWANSEEQSNQSGPINVLDWRTVFNSNQCLLSGRDQPGLANAVWDIKLNLIPKSRSYALVRHYILSSLQLYANMRGWGEGSGYKD